VATTVETPEIAFKAAPVAYAMLGTMCDITKNARNTAAIKILRSTFIFLNPQNRKQRLDYQALLQLRNM